MDCPVCGGPVVRDNGHAPHKIYCSKKCKQRATNIRRWPDSKDNPPKAILSTDSCAGCGAEFVPRRAGRQQLYCSSACRMRITSRRRFKELLDDPVGHAERKRYLRTKHFEKKYGISLDARDAMILGRGSRCDICGDVADLHVDHDHDTDEIRGMLCFNCNVALGYMKDDVVRLQGAIDYLKGGCHYDG